MRSSAAIDGYRLPTADEVPLFEPWLATQPSGTAFWVAADAAGVGCPVAARA